MDNTFKSLTYVDKEPDVRSLQTAYEETTADLESYFDLCRSSYDDRRNWWPGKSRDLRKHGADAFPWEGAADLESHIINERVTKLVSMLLMSLKRANVQANPVEIGDIPRSKMVSGFMKWMVSSGYIPRFFREMELGANYLLERGILVTYVGWQKEDKRFIQRISLEQIAEIDPEIVEKILNGEHDDELISLIQNTFDGVSKKKGKRALKDLRKSGSAELPIVRRKTDAPLVKTLAPDGDFYFPAYVTDPQKAPYCFWRTYYTAQELENKVVTDGWDEDFVNEMIEKFRGVNIDSVEREQGGRNTVSLTETTYESDGLIEIVHVYQRLVDQEDGAQGIYETVMHRNFTGDEANGVSSHAKFQLLNGYEDYPVVVTKLSEDGKRLYDPITIPSILRGLQHQVKVERDSRCDRNSLATLPPMMHPQGNRPSDYGPGRYIPYRRKGELEFGPVPQYNPGSVEIERTMERQADALTGLDFEDPISQSHRQYYIDKYLSHCAEVLKLVFKCFQRFGPDEVFFRVTGNPDSQTFSKGDPDEDYDVMINFDVLNTDPESQEKKLSQLVSLTQLDRNGRINIDSLLSAIASSIDPVLADAVLQPAEESQEQVVKQVTDDLSKIFAGIEMPARPNGSQIAMQIIQQYAQQEDVMQRIQQDEAFRARLEKYQGQYVFMQQQAQNAEIGKIGTAPAQMGEMSTQSM
ncbi:MAG: hypothetical protein KJO69_00110 [Gammaproteobacteria bacterium]|nr:hypothetical protein [Gammaproteobacteria bacterium]